MIEIKVNVDNVESIRKGVKSYAELIKSREGIKGEEYASYLGITFVDMDGNALKVEEIKSDRVLEVYEEYWGYSYGGRSNEEIFFAKALEHEEVKEDILTALLEVVNYAREKNETSDLRADGDNNLIGLGSIYAFVKLYPEYTYLLGLYLIPYWDEEHAPYALDLIVDLAIDMGIGRETIKLFCHSDNEFLRSSIFDNMTDWFRENKDEYDRFREVLKERFVEYPFLADIEGEESESAIDEFYLSLICDRPDWDSCEDGESNEFSDFFVYDSAQVEAATLKDEIEKELAKRV